MQNDRDEFMFLLAALGLLAVLTGLLVGTVGVFKAFGY